MKTSAKSESAVPEQLLEAVREIAMLHLTRDHPFVVKLYYTIENQREWAIGGAKRERTRMLWICFEST